MASFGVLFRTSLDGGTYVWYNERASFEDDTHKLDSGNNR